MRCAYFVAFNYVYIYTLFVQLFALFVSTTCVAALLCLSFVFVCFCFYMIISPRNYSLCFIV